MLTKELSEELYFLDAALILKGQFMGFSKSDNQVVTRGLVAKRDKGILGAIYLTFYLPGGKQFYSVITAFGE